MVLEQFLNSSPAEVRVWVQEHKPKTSEAAAQLADNYLQARQDSVVSEGTQTLLCVQSATNEVTRHGTVELEWMIKLALPHLGRKGI